MGQPFVIWPSCNVIEHSSSQYNVQITSDDDSEETTDSDSEANFDRHKRTWLALQIQWLWETNCVYWTWNPMSLTPLTSDLPPTDINLTVHNYVQNSPFLSRASQDKLLSQGWRLAQNALSTSARWKNAKIVPTLTCLFEPKISVFFFPLDF